MLDNLKEVNNKGFSLVEMIIYIAILAGVVLTFVFLVLSVARTQSKAYVVEEISSNARVAMNIIADTIRRADDVIFPTEGNSSTSLVLDMPNTTDNTTYSLSGGVIYQTVGTGTPVAITTNDVTVSSLNFENLTTLGKRENIRVSFSLDFTNSDSVGFQYSRSFQFSVSLRK